MAVSGRRRAVPAGQVHSCLLLSFEGDILRDLNGSGPGWTRANGLAGDPTGLCSVQGLADLNTELAERVAKGRERRRRMKIVRNVVPLLVVGVLLCAAAIRLRNRAYLTEARASFEADVADLIRIVEETGNVPLLYPPRGPDGQLTAAPGFTYIDSTTVQHLRDLDQDLIVAYSQSIRQILAPYARMVAVRTGSRVEVRVMELTEFRRILDEQERQAAQAVQAARDRAIQLP